MSADQPFRRSDRTVTPALLLILVLALLFPGACCAVDEVEQASPSAVTAPGKHGEGDVSTGDQETTTLGHAVDTSHAGLEQGILEQVVRLDDFFGNVRAENRQQTRYLVRWRTSLRIDDRGKVSPGMAVRANLQLSNLDERLRLVVAEEDEREQSPGGLPQDPGSPGFYRSSASARITNTELRYTLYQTPALNLFLGAGVRISLSPEAFIRSRFQYTKKLDERSLFRCTETLFLKDLKVPGQTAEIEAEHQLAKSTLLRWGNLATASSEIRGVEWGSELSLIRELPSNAVTTFAGGVFGRSSSGNGIDTFRLLARYRQNIFRDWLFYELEPELFWPRDETGRYPARFAFTARLEIMFQGKE